MAELPGVGVVMLAYGDEPVLDRAIDAVLASKGVDVSLVVVDNGCPRPDLADLTGRDGIELVRPSRNLGFAGRVHGRGVRGEPASAHASACDVASASGAGLVVRRALWEQLGGFPAAFFAYQEDVELSWRVWQAGLRVRYVPDAVVVHHYEFSRNDLKMYLLERNRLLFVLTCYGSRTLALLALPLLAFEVAMGAVALTQGWGRQKARGWVWVVRHLRWIRARRRLVQGSRVVPDHPHRALVRLWTDRFDPAAIPLPG